MKIQIKIIILITFLNIFTFTACDWFDKDAKTIKVPVQGISLNKSAANIMLDVTEQLTAEVTPSNATNRSVTWSSSNEAAAIVSSSGLITTKAAGTSTITVTTADGGKTASCNITVITPVEFVTTGSSFSPVIVVNGTPEILWVWDDGTTGNSSTPVKDYGSAGKRTNRLIVVPWSALQRINIGYDAGDGGDNSIEFVADQNVESVSGMESIAPYLKQWCSSYNSIKALDFSNFLLLDTIECYLSSSLESVILKNTPELGRACFEQCSLTALDLSECPKLGDLRGADNRYPTIIFGTATNTNLWHICVRDNDFTETDLFSDMSQFPNIKDLYIWQDNQTGNLAVKSTAASASIMASRNQYTSADFSGAFTGSEGYGMIVMDYNQLTSINIDGCSQLTTVSAISNQLNAAAVDYILQSLDSFGRDRASTDSYIELIVDLSGTGNEPPSEDGLIHVTNLRAKGWTVNVN